MINASAVARVLGIESTYVELRNGTVQFLPQQLGILAQGSSGVAYSTAKFTAANSGEVGARFGYGSPAHLIARELFGAGETGGDGVGSIPVTFYPLAEGGGATAAVGNIVPSGTPTSVIERKLRIGGILSLAFSIPLGALATAANLHTALRRMGNAVNNVQAMPVRATYTYGAVSAAALVGTGNGTVTTFTTTGNPQPGLWRLQNVSAVANGGVWSLTDPEGNVVSTTLTMTPGAGAATALSAGGLGFTLTDGTTDFGLGAYFDITVPATNVVFTSNWKGLSANAIQIELIGDTAGITFAITQPTGGTVDPTVDSALALLGTKWETMLLNALGIDNVTALDTINAIGEGRWGELVHKPFVCFTGNTYSTVSAATAVCNTRTADRINAQLVAPGSTSLPFVVAARQLARIAKVANDNPARDYGSKRANGLVPGADNVQWTYPQRDQAVKLGSSTSEVRDSVVTIGDVVTFYRPTNEDPPGFRYVVDIVRTQQVIYNTALIFNTEEWDGAPLIPDEEVSVNTEAKQPKMAKAEIAAMIDSLADQAIVGNRVAAKASITAVINAGNSKRLDLDFTTPYSGNTNIIGVRHRFGFLFGSQAA
jgi:phage tail sheath gpL-like